jgi:hypothetical protein
VKALFVTKGSRIKYRVGGELLAGTVFAIKPIPRQERLDLGLPEFGAFHHFVAENPGEKILKSQIVESISPDELKDNIVIALLSQAVFNNIKRSKAAVVASKTPLTPLQKKVRFNQRNNFTTVQI